MLHFLEFTSVPCKTILIVLVLVLHHIYNSWETNTTFSCSFLSAIPRLSRPSVSGEDGSGTLSQSFERKLRNFLLKSLNYSVYLETIHKSNFQFFTILLPLIIASFLGLRKPNVTSPHTILDMFKNSQFPFETLF